MTKEPEKKQLHCTNTLNVYTALIHSTVLLQCTVLRYYPTLLYPYTALSTECSA